jgi:hypothetical protein
MSKLAEENLGFELGIIDFEWFIELIETPILVS